MINTSAFMASVTILEHQQRVEAQTQGSAIGASIGRLAKRALKVVTSLVA